MTDKEATTAKLYQAFQKASGVTTDSRQVKPGQIFFALKGEHFDGNAYADQALVKGASLVVVDDPDLSGREHHFFVDDSLVALQSLARHHRKQLSATFIGITGSNGKTTTKELFHRVLSKKFKTAATAGNLNNHIGVPLTILSLPANTEMAIIEMGANHQGEIAILCDIAMPEYGLITNIGKAHLEGFGGFEGVIRAKTELYAFIRKTHGKIFINGDNDLLTGKAQKTEKIVYGGNPRFFSSGKLTKSFPYVKAEIKSDSEKIQIDSKLTGSYNFENILAAACAAFYFEIEAYKIKEAIESYVPDNNRSQVIQTPLNLVILDAYNANPTSMYAAIFNFLESGYRDKVVILGEMLELGEDSANEHQNLIHYLKGQPLDEIYLIGRAFADIVPAGATHFELAEKCVDYFRSKKIKGKTILVKGSRKNRLEQLMPYL